MEGGVVITTRSICLKPLCIVSYPLAEANGNIFLTANHQTNCTAIRWLKPTAMILTVLIHCRPFQGTG
jgi:hypothetical protein